jgi:hypothetical protein
MPIYKGLVTIKRDGRYHPPGSLHDLSEDEAKGLGPSRIVLAPDQVAATAAIALESVCLPVGETNAGMPAGSESAGDAPSDAPPSVVVSPDDEQKGGASDRIADIKAAFDLLDAERDYFKSGKRAGKPKQKPVEEIVGFDVSDGDIDAALALRDAGL